MEVPAREKDRITLLVSPRIQETIDRSLRKASTADPKSWANPARRARRRRHTREPESRTWINGARPFKKWSASILKRTCFGRS